MDLELLRTFLEVERLRHFGQAAEGLHLTQAAVSARIKQLETLLGVKLFDRVRKDIRLTPQGVRLVRYADRLIAEWRKARQDVAAGGALEQLTVGGSLRLWDPLLQQWLHRLRRLRPDMAMIAESHSPEVLTRRLLDGALDVAFMLEPAQLDVLNIEKVALMRLVMVSSVPDSTARAALEEGYVMVDWGLAHAVHHRRLFPDAAEPKVRLGQAKMALSYLLELGGAGYLPLRMVSDALSAGDLYLVGDAPAIDCTAYAVFCVRTGREQLIRDSLTLFEDDRSLQEALQFYQPSSVV